MVIIMHIVSQSVRYIKIKAAAAAPLFPLHPLPLKPSGTLLSHS